MSLADRQVKAILNKILKESFQKGLIPSLGEVTKKINQAFGSSAIGAPLTKFRAANNRKTSNPDDWNQTVDELKTDLDLLYDESTDQISRILSDFDYYEVEKRKLERRLDSLQDKVRELILLNNNADGYLYSVYDNFRDLARVDTETSSAWLDLGLYEVCLPHSKVGNRKIDISDAEITGAPITKDGLISSTDLEDLKNCLSDNINSAWICRIVTTDTSGVDYRVNVKCNGEQTTRIQINPHVTTDITIDLSYSDATGGWNGAGSRATQSTVVWDFSENTVSGLDLVITKKQYDEKASLEDGTVGYVYYIGLQNISLLKIGFERDGTLRSEPLYVKDRQNNPVIYDKISLETQDEVPVGCGIDYYLAIRDASEDEHNTPIGWQPILPIGSTDSNIPKIIDFKTISSMQAPLALNSNSSSTYNDGKPINGLYFYTMGDPIYRNIVKTPDSLVLVRGVNQYKTESFYYSGWAIHEPSLNDWFSLPSGSTALAPSYQDMGLANNINVAKSRIYFPTGTNNISYKVTTSIYLEDMKTVTSSLGLTGGNSMKIKVLLNGLPINQDLDIPNITSTSNGMPVQWSFIAGWNTITILAFKNFDSSCYLDIGFDPTSISSKVRTEQDPLTFVPLFDLLYNIPEKDSGKYSLDDDNRIVISGYQKAQGGRYEFYYKYQIQTGQDSYLLFRADLKGSGDPALTPKLKYYKVRVS